MIDGRNKIDKIIRPRTIALAGKAAADVVVRGISFFVRSYKLGKRSSGEINNLTDNKISTYGTYTHDSASGGSTSPTATNGPS